MALDFITPVSGVHRRDLAVTNTNNVDPDHLAHVQAGEWMGLDANGKAQEAGEDVAAGDGGNAVAGEGPFYQVFSQKGDSAAQALGKICVVMSLDYEAETDMYEDSTTITAGTELTVSRADTGGGATGDTTRNILTPAVTTNVVVGVCTMAASATASGKLRFQRTSPYIKA